MTVAVSPPPACVFTGQDGFRLHYHDVGRRLFGTWGKLGPRHWQRLGEIRHRTLLLWGREDRIIPLDGALHMLHQMRNARLTVFPKCGHWCQFEAAREFEDQIISFTGSEETA